MEDLQKRIAQLEEELKLEKLKNEVPSVARPKIGQMSSEVVDSNPYRLYPYSNDINCIFSQTKMIHLCLLI